MSIDIKRVGCLSPQMVLGRALCQILQKELPVLIGFLGYIQTGWLEGRFCLLMKKFHENSCLQGNHFLKIQRYN